MHMERTSIPNWVATILSSRALNLVARVLVTYLFWSSGLEKLFGFHDATVELSRLGLPAPGALAAALVLTQLGGSALMIWGRYAWFGAGWLAVFTLITIPIAHHFWNMPPAQRLMEAYLVREHLSLCAGLFLTAALCSRLSETHGHKARRGGR
jgi:transmembrane protein